ncbi:MAG: UDP-N-acetylmuramoyl-tripeptide--D-alanyl-D-alanine ligase [Bacilli bacterium]|nr:UDP-N-acetylmuramoyl-tripeptide--D-alanyl-D-alanine ligase [Bacilli bacterium]
MLTYFIIALLIYAVYICIKAKKALHMLQQNWYDDDHRYLKWIVGNKEKVFISTDSFFIIFIAFLFMGAEIQAILFAAFYFVNILFIRNKHRKEQTKLSLVVTARVRRLLVTLVILYLIPIVGMCFYLDAHLLPYYFLTLGAMAYFTHFMVMLANIINIPIEKQVFYHFRRQAKRKLKRMSNLKVVGITGSYGKTSSKNILSDILNVKLNATPTPKNFNTPYGLINSINNYLDKFSDVFIAEMGAFKRGEIAELCELVKPTYGILTRVGTAHLESFGSRENIQRGKFELIESLPWDGVGVLNGDDEYQTSYELKNDCRIIWIGIDNKDVDVRATNITLTKEGTTFDCIFKGDKKKYHFETKLLGKANIYNILASIALSKEFGIAIDQIILGVKKVLPVEHRLELKKMGDVHIIDDAYNSNPVGSKMALDVLDLMPGKKIVVTPGMIELGAEQYEMNLKFGEYIAAVADEVILVGAEQTRPIQLGLEAKEFDAKKVHIINDVKEAFPMIQRLKSKETYVLIENDLPDIFNEK